MKDPMDPRVDLLVAALYGELSPEEFARFEKQLESDPVLRAEWDELRATRRILTAWEIEERVPSFVRVAPEPARREPARPRARWWDRLRHPVPAAGWAFAAAAAILAILAVSQARIDLLDRGIAFRFGPPSQAELEAPASTPESSPGGTAAPPATGEIGGSHPGVSQVNGAPEGWVVPRSDSLQVRLSGGDDLADASAPMTRQEFEAFTAGMAKVITAMQSQNEYNLQQNQEFLAFVRTMYQGLSEKQADDYYELRGRIESVRYGLTEVETTTNDRLDMIDLRQGEPLSPGVIPSEAETEQKEKEDE